MRLINPAGNGMNADGNTIQPRACMCSSKGVLQVQKVQMDASIAVAAVLTTQ